MARVRDVLYPLHGRYRCCGNLQIVLARFPQEEKARLVKVGVFLRHTLCYLVANETHYRMWL